MLAQVFGTHVAHRFELQISLVLQVPQLSLPPQPSSSVPQFLPALAQVLGVQALQRFDEQISLVWQVPQLSLPPQPSSSAPQFLLSEAQVLGVQALQILDEQISLVWQVPQLSLPPQPSSSVPQFLLSEAQVLGVQALQILDEQISLVWQVPQLSLPPQPSSSVPQFLPVEAHVSGVQVTHRLLLQVCPGRQLPQSWVTPAMQLSENLPHSMSAIVQATGGTVDVVGQVQLSRPPHPSDKVPHTPVGKSLHLTFLQTPQVKVTASHTWPVGHPAHAVVAPQPSGMLPQRPSQATGSQAVHWLFLHLKPMPQVLPQAKLLPQTSVMKPQALLPVQAASCELHVLVCGLQIRPWAQMPQ
jgi:hypothetical protein